MPWHTVSDATSGCPADKPFAVVEDDSGDVESCWSTEQEATDQIVMLDAMETQTESEAASAQLPEWEGVIAVEGVTTGDGRQFALDSLSWADLPVPLRWNKEDSHGGEPHTVAVNVGRIDQIWRDGSTIFGRGVFNTNEDDGRRAYELVKGNFLNGISVDADNISDSDIELVWPETGPEDTDEDSDLDLFDMLFASPELVIFHTGRIRAATLCDIPAFVEATIQLVTEVVDTGVGATTSSDSSMNELITTLVAHGGSDWLPPREWFDNPRLSMPTGITVTDTGRVYGHAALWGACHIGHPGTCVTPPHEDDHPYFMTGELICADGSRAPVGQLTLGTQHAPLSWNASVAHAHYDDTGTAVADVSVGEDGHGIWVAGAIRPDVPSAKVRELRASGQVSGDWRRIGGRLRLVGLLAVNVPGFPVPKMSARITSGTQFALVAAGYSGIGHGDLAKIYEQDTFRSIMNRLATRVHGREDE